MCEGALMQISGSAIDSLSGGLFLDRVPSLQQPRLAKTARRCSKRWRRTCFPLIAFLSSCCLVLLSLYILLCFEVAARSWASRRFFKAAARKLRAFLCLFGIVVRCIQIYLPTVRAHAREHRAISSFLLLELACPSLFFLPLGWSWCFVGALVSSLALAVP